MNQQIAQSIVVLLATYQGSSFLLEQINSLIAQTYPNIAILARDDGSTDATCDILRRFEEQGILNWSVGENIGVKRSFAQLLHEAPSAAAYAFCDQDDIWKSDKLERAMSHIQSVPSDVPVLYFSQTELVDETGQPLGKQQPVIKRDTGFQNALVQNVVTGCTAVMNASARELLNRANPRWSEVRMHDWWVYLVISAFGKVIYDFYPSVKYRQHGKNQVGTTNLSFKKRMKRFLNPDRIITRQAKEFQRCYGNLLSADKKQLLEDFLSDQNRWKLAFQDRVYRQRQLDNLFLRVLLLLGRL